MPMRVDVCIFIDNDENIILSEVIYISNGFCWFLRIQFQILKKIIN